MVSLHLKAIVMLVCLKRLVIFLICGDVYVNVVHGPPQTPQHPLPINPTRAFLHTVFPQRREAHFRTEPC